MQLNTTVDPKLFGALLLNIGIGLLRAGSSGSRIRNTIAQITTAYGHSLHIDIGPKSISITLLDKIGRAVFNGTRSADSYGVNFKILSGINRLSLSVAKQQWSLEDISKEVDRLLNLPHYTRIVTLVAVSTAGAGFCYTFGGHLAEMGVTFGATFCGLFVKQELQKRTVNAYACTFISALVAALFTGAFFAMGLGLRVENAFATCALFLIPGVPLINSIVDLINGDILFGMERGVNAMIHAFAIAFGLVTALFIYNVAG